MKKNYLFDIKIIQSAMQVQFSAIWCNIHSLIGAILVQSKCNAGAILVQSQDASAMVQSALIYKGQKLHHYCTFFAPLHLCDKKYSYE